MPDINQAIMQARAQVGGPRGVRANPTMIPPRLQAFAQKHGMQAAQDRFAKWRAGGLPGQQVGGGLTGGNTMGDSPFGPGIGGGQTAVGGGLGGGSSVGSEGGGPAGGGFDYEGGPTPAGPGSGGIYAGGPTPAYLQTKPAAMPLPFNPNGGPLTGNMDQLGGGNTMGDNPFGTTSLGGTTGVGGGAGGGVSTGADGGGPAGPIPGGLALGGGVGGPMIPPGGGNTTPPWSPLPGGLAPPQMKTGPGIRVGPPRPGNGGGVARLPKKGGSNTKMKVQSGLGAMNNGALQGF